MDNKQDPVKAVFNRAELAEQILQYLSDDVDIKACQFINKIWASEVKRYRLKWKSVEFVGPDFEKELCAYSTATTRLDRCHRQVKFNQESGIMDNDINYKAIESFGLKNQDKITHATMGVRIFWNAIQGLLLVTSLTVQISDDFIFWDTITGDLIMPNLKKVTLAATTTTEQPQQPRVLKRHQLFSIYDLGQQLINSCPVLENWTLCGDSVQNEIIPILHSSFIRQRNLGLLEQHDEENNNVFQKLRSLSLRTIDTNNRDNFPIFQVVLLPIQLSELEIDFSTFLYGSTEPEHLRNVVELFNSQSQTLRTLSLYHVKFVDINNITQKSTIVCNIPFMPALQKLKISYEFVGRLNNHSSLNPPPPVPKLAASIKYKMENGNVSATIPQLKEISMLKQYGESVVHENDKLKLLELFFPSDRNKLPSKCENVKFVFVDNSWIPDNDTNSDNNNKKKKNRKKSPGWVKLEQLFPTAQVIFI